MRPRGWPGKQPTAPTPTSVANCRFFEVASGNLAGRFELPANIAADFERIAAESADFRERFIFYAPEESGDYVSIFTTTSELPGVDGISLSINVMADPAAANVIVHTHPIGNLGFVNLVNRRQSETDLNCAIQGAVPLRFVVSTDGFVTALQLPASFEPGTEVLPPFIAADTALQAIADAELMRREDNFRRNTQSTFTDFEQYLDQVVNPNPEIQSFLAMEGFSTVQEVLAEAERLEELAVANLDFDILLEFRALSERLDMATAAAGLPDVGELFGPFPLLSTQEESEIAAQSNLDFIGEWANRNGIQVFDGRLGSPTMTRVP